MMIMIIVNAVIMVA